MSATNRVPKGTNKLEVFRTPSWVCRRLLEACPLPGGVWLEPSAGEGAIIEAVNLVRQDVLWGAVELRPNCQRRLSGLIGAENVHIGSYLTTTTVDLLRLQESARAENSTSRAQVTISNPPFSLAQEIIEHSWERSQHIVMLLMLNYLGSDTRVDFMRRYPPNCFVLPERPMFEKGRSDSVVYGWLHWEPQRERSHGKLVVLGPTPVEERRADRLHCDQIALPDSLEPLAEVLEVQAEISA